VAVNAGGKSAKDQPGIQEPGCADICTYHLNAQLESNTTDDSYCNCLL